MNGLDAVSIVLIVLALVDAAVTWDLVRAASVMKEPALSDRAEVSVILTVIACALALLAMNRLLALHLDNGLVIVILVGSFLLVSLPQIRWWWKYRRGGFR